MATLTYPSNAMLLQIAQDLLPRLTQDRPIFNIFPIVNQDTHVLMWEQKDNYKGLQQVRGLNGDPGKVQAIGGKRYTMEPGVYGEFLRIDETELTVRRNWGTFNTPIPVDDLVREKQDQILQRMLDRIEVNGWTLLTTGTFSVYGPDQALMHTDSFPLQTFTASPGWGTTATATPLADLRAIKLLARGHSVKFGAGSTLYINQTTANNILANTNSADLYGRRTTGLATINNFGDLNKLLAGDDLPSIQVYDDGYIDDSSTFQLFIPNNKGVLVGQRPAGQTVGEYRMTRNANNNNFAPGMYMKVIDQGEDQVPRTLEVHGGHNGGPVIYFPSAIVTLSV